LEPSSRRSSPLISVITVVRNDATGIARTLASIRDQDHADFELIVVDGASTDRTLEIVHRFESEIDKWISEPDNGTYHAMNKGIALATGQWLLFMNAGDEFASRDALSTAAASINPTNDIIYADWIYRETGDITKADLSRLNIRHQSVLYRKSLHQGYGLYVVGYGVSISDYIFFLAVSDCRWSYCEHPISICDKAGASGKSNHFHQRIAADFIFSRRRRVMTVAILLLHPIYRFLKMSLFRGGRLSSTK
jgi:glycosyltransferase involved in cell wall biosynthesis